MPVERMCASTAVGRHLWGVGKTDDTLAAKDLKQRGIRGSTLTAEDPNSLINATFSMFQIRGLDWVLVFVVLATRPIQQLGFQFGSTGCAHGPM